VNTQNSSVFVTKSKNGLTIPVVNDVYIHSKYDPKKEAEEFAYQNIEKVQRANTFLILGLGFGYHINEFVKLTKIKHQNIQIAVLEPDQTLIEKYYDCDSIEKPNVKIFTETNIRNLFSNPEFLQFLQTRPCVMAFTPSFNLNRTFYQSFLEYRASNLIQDFKGDLSPQLKEYFPNNYQGEIENWISDLNSAHKPLTNTDYFLLAYSELVSGQDTDVEL